MPFRAGMLTERQHPHPMLEAAIREAAWDLYFRDDPVCAPPEYAANPGIDPDAILRGQPMLVFAGGSARADRRTLSSGSPVDDIDACIRETRRASRQSWSNLLKAVKSLQGKPNEPFGTRNVQATARSTVRRIQRETRWELAALECRLTTLRP